MFVVESLPFSFRSLKSEKVLEEHNTKLAKIKFYVKCLIMLAKDEKITC